MDIRQSDYFITIAEEKSISRAAGRLFISQPALSQQLSQLEQELGARLFLRKGHSLELTEAGRIYLNCAYNIMHINGQAMEKIKELSTAPKAPLRLGVSSLISPVHITEIAGICQTAHPDRQLSLTMAPDPLLLRQLERQTDRQVDAVLTVKEDYSADDSLHVLLLYREPGVILYPESISEPFSCSLVPYIGLTGVTLPGMTCHTAADRTTQALSIQTLSTDSLSLIPSLLARFQGYSVVPESFARSLTSQSGFRIQTAVDVSFSIRLVWQKDDSAAGLEGLAETCRTYFESLLRGRCLDPQRLP